jgi:hypothetical protein
VPTDLVSSLAGSDFWTPVNVPLLPAPGVGQQIPTLVKDALLKSLALASLQTSKIQFLTSILLESIR